MKYRMRIAVVVLLFLSVAFGIGGTLLISVSFSNNLRQEERTAVDSYQSVLNMLSVVNSLSPQAYYGNVVDVLEQLEESGGGHWDGLALTVDNRVVYASSDVTYNIRDVRNQVHAGQLLLTRFSSEESYFLQVSGRLTAGDQVLYLDSIYDITTIYDSRAAQQRIYRYVFIAIIAVGALLSWLMATLLTRPMEELSRTARQIAEGDLSERAQIGGEDEVGRLAADFNQMADELERHIDELQDAMDRQEAFMGNFAHELKTPMTAIIGYADLLRTEQLSGEKAQEAANYIFSEGKRLENLSLKLLDLLVARRTDPEFVTASPKKLVEDAARLMQPALEERGITLTTDCEEGTREMEPTLVMSLLINLIDNARKAMDEGGVITVCAHLVPEGCIFTVQDEGTGIPPEDLARITDAFYRVDKARSRSMGGVGLGLALCREIAEVHGGDITFENVEPHGTRVTVRLGGGEDA